MKKQGKNIGASVRARLLNLARKRGEDYQLVLTRYANERILYRLSQSKHARDFILKGAALFTVWREDPHRATRDLDLLGFGEPNERHIADVFSEVADLGHRIKRRFSCRLALPRQPHPRTKSN